MKALGCCSVDAGSWVHYQCMGQIAVYLEFRYPTHWSQSFKEAFKQEQPLFTQTTPAYFTQQTLTKLEHRRHNMTAACFLQSPVSAFGRGKSRASSPSATDRLLSHQYCDTFLTGISLRGGGCAVRVTGPCSSAKHQVAVLAVLCRGANNTHVRYLVTCAGHKHLAKRARHLLSQVRHPLWTEDKPNTGCTQTSCLHNFVQVLTFATSAQHAAAHQRPRGATRCTLLQPWALLASCPGQRSRQRVLSPT